MRATLEEVQSAVSELKPEWPNRMELGARARDSRLIIDVSNCSAIAYNYSLVTAGNTLEATNRHGDVRVFKPLKDAKKLAQTFIEYANRVEGYGFEEGY